LLVVTVVLVKRIGHHTAWQRVIATSLGVHGSTLGLSRPICREQEMFCIGDLTFSISLKWSWTNTISAPWKCFDNWCFTSYWLDDFKIAYLTKPW